MSQTPMTARRASFSLRGLMEVGGVLLCAATLAGFLARLWWVCELATHFRWHLAVGLAVVTGLAAWVRHRRLAALCAVFALVNAGLVLRVLLPVETPGPATGIPLRVVSLNVHTENEQMDRVLDFLQHSEADVILLMEVNDAWLKALQPLRTNYAQVLAEPREDNFGIALFSRVALTNSTVVELGQAEVPSIVTIGSISGQQFALLGTHPLPPGSADYARRRNDQLQAIAQWGRSQSLPAVVAGDLNCTPWSPYFTDLLRDSGLKNISCQRGLFGSWPAWCPIGRLPLDQGLVSPVIRIREKRVGPTVGSDHLPILLQLELPRSH